MICVRQELTTLLPVWGVLHVNAICMVLPNFQCLAGGECTCRSGLEGEKCETCSDGYFGLGTNGCESSNCRNVKILDH